MNSIDSRLLMLSIFIVIIFIIAGLAIALRNIWLVSLFIIFGLLLINYGLKVKRRRK